MDKRCEPRFSAEQSVAITTLGRSPHRQTATIRNASESGLGLFVKTAIPPGTALRVELDDAIMLGEAMYCRPMETGHFVGVQLEQVLHGLNELHSRFRAFAEEAGRDCTETR
jgi:hypothetical protein